MTLNEIIEKAKFEKHEEFDIWSMAEILKLDYYNIVNFPNTSLITQYYFIEWLCTDTKVGESVLFLNNEPVAITSQKARKSELNVQWLSSDCYYKVYNYVKSFIKEENNFEVLSELDKLKEYGETYSVKFTGQLFKNKQLFYNDEQVEYIGFGCPMDCIDKTVIVKFKNGFEKLIDVSQLKIAFFKENLNEI